MHDASSPLLPIKSNKRNLYFSSAAAFICIWSVIERNPTSHMLRVLGQLMADFNYLNNVTKPLQTLSYSA